MSATGWLNIDKPDEIREWFDCNFFDTKRTDEERERDDRLRQIREHALVTLVVYGPSSVQIEEETLYTVLLPNPLNLNDTGFVLVRLPKDVITIKHIDDEDWKNKKYCQLTESEIKENHSYLWPLAEKVNKI